LKAQRPSDSYAQLRCCWTANTAYLASQNCNRCKVEATELICKRARFLWQSRKIVKQHQVNVRSRRTAIKLFIGGSKSTERTQITPTSTHICRYSHPSGKWRRCSQRIN